jgi:uncharacterized alpha-E superfamily protein
MLSRLAESFFWMGRYLERAEGTSRLLLEHHQLMVQQHLITPRRAAQILLETLDLPTDDCHESTFINTVYGNETSQSTILGSITAARSNARAVRESIASDLYEALNSAYFSARKELPNPQYPGALLRTQIQRLAMINGVLEWTSPRDDSYQFLQLGRSIERLDLTSRLIAARYDRWWPEQGPASALRAIDGFGAFLRGRVPVQSNEVRSFLIADPTFPRSMRYSAGRAQRQLGLLTTGNRMILRDISLLSNDLEYFATSASPSEEEIDQLVRRAIDAASSTTAKISQEFFRPVGSIVWSS